MKVFLGLALIFLPAVAFSKDLSWTKQEGIQRKGHQLRVIATGAGPTQSLARRDAIAQAQATASDLLGGSVTVNSTAIQGEKSSAYYSSVTSKKQVELLCNPLRESTTEKDGAFETIIQCEFDTRKVKLTKSGSTPKTSSKSNSMIDSPPDEESPESPVIQNQTKLGSKRILSISTVPQCISVLVVGRPRILACNSNPVDITIFPEDSEILIRAPKGYKDREIKLRERSPANSTESLEVYFERY